MRSFVAYAPQDDNRGDIRMTGGGIRMTKRPLTDKKAPGLEVRGFCLTYFFRRKTGMPKAELPAISVASTRAHFIPLGKSNTTVFLP